MIRHRDVTPSRSILEPEGREPRKYVLSLAKSEAVSQGDLLCIEAFPVPCRNLDSDLKSVMIGEDYITFVSWLNSACVNFCSLCWASLTFAVVAKFSAKTFLVDGKWEPCFDIITLT